MDIKISAKGWVVIPAKLRAKYNLKPGTDLRVVDYGDVLALVPSIVDPIRSGAGMLKKGSSLTQTIIEEHRQERDRE